MNALLSASLNDFRVRLSQTGLPPNSLLAFARARSALYSLEGLIGPIVEMAVHRRRPYLPTDDKVLFPIIRAAIDELLRADVGNIERGIYPADVLWPENPVTHLARLPRMFRSALALTKRRERKDAHEFSAEALALMEDLPEYYKRCFHYQGDGYLSAESADLYEHQVEILFAGSADAMRRLVILPLRARFGETDGAGLKFLELGAGTGRATRFVRLAFPKAKIVALDLSAPYLKKAQMGLAAYAHHDFVEGDAAALSYKDEAFDAVYSVFLMHELPQAERERVIAEAARVLKPAGVLAIVDSLQLGDRTEFDEPLKRFPRDFHEPFYRNYISHPLAGMIEDTLNSSARTEQGFFSKVVSATKATPL